jgi:hypothetical protein
MFERKTLLPCLIKDDVFQTAVWNMECPGKPQVTLLAECHVGTPQYFQMLDELLGQTTPQVWTGIESMQRREDLASLPRKIRRRIQVLRHEIELRTGLAAPADLTARHVSVSTEGRTIIGPRDDEFVATWGTKQALLMRLVNMQMQKLVDSSRGGNPKAVQQCRNQVAGRLRGIARLLQMPERMERLIAEDDALWHNRAFSAITDALNKEREVRLQMGALHIVAIRARLELEGYVLAAEQWLPCADLAQLSPASTSSA